MADQGRPTSQYVEWGVEVWPDSPSPYNRVDPYPSRESAEAALRDAYGSATRLVCRSWQPAHQEPRFPCLPSLGEHCGACHRCTAPTDLSDQQGQS